MYNVLTAIKNNMLLQELKRLHIWGASTGLTLLQTIRQEKLCQAIAMVGQTAEFKIVRKSFLLGVDDYLITPFEISQFISLFGKIEHAEHGKIEAENSQKESLHRSYPMEEVELSEECFEELKQVCS